jgi:hypothetical protein
MVFQVGNAVPPPMARQIGYEIRRSVEWRTKKDNDKRKLKTIKETGEVKEEKKE